MEALRYLGYCGAAAEPDIVELVKKITAELEACVNPKSSFEIYDCVVNPPVVTLGGMTIESASLAEHLKGCDRAALMAATLGTGADLLIRRYSVLDMGKAVVVQAVCTAMLEAYCDEIERKIDGLYLTARFSPGYGDFDIVHQKDILRLLDCGRRMGLTLTDGYMLVPSKSVTAVIGLSEEKKRARGKCENCTDMQCAFREMNP